MGQRRSLFIGIDQPLEAAWGLAAYAESGAAELAKIVGGVELLGRRATKTVIESHVRRLRKSSKPGDTLIVGLVGRGFSKSGRGYLVAWDTQPDDPLDTAIPIRDLLKELQTSKASEIVLILDVGIGPEFAGFDAFLDDAELTSLFDESPKAVALASCAPGEESTVSGQYRSGTALRLIGDALAGRSAAAITKSGTVTVKSLHQMLRTELPRVLRKQFDPGVRQTPVLYGLANSGIVLADLGPRVNSEPLLDAERLKRIVFRTEAGGKVRDLAGFRKTFQLPERASPSAKKFIAKCATDDLRDDLNRLYEQVRAAFGYKRKDVDTGIDDGIGTLRTPDFEYTIRVVLDEADPTLISWRREIGGFTEPGFVRGPAFRELFGPRFDQLVFEFDTPLDVAAWIDRFEETPPKGAKLRIDSDGEACELTLAGLSGELRIEQRTVTVCGRGRDCTGLLDQFLAFLRNFGPGATLALPG